MRLGHGPARALLIGAGIAAATAALVGLYAGTRVAQDKDVADRVARLPDETKAIRLQSFTVSGQSEPYASLDRLARTTLTPVLDREPIATVLYRESTIGGKYLGLGAVDGMRPWVTLRSGRFPKRCGVDRCEVVQIRGRGGIPNVRGLRLIRVGTGDLRTATLFGDAIAPAENARAEAALSESFRRSARYHLPAPPPIVLAEGVAALNGLPGLEDEFRTYSWIVPLERGDVRVWSVASLNRSIDQARSTAQSRSESFEIRAPIDELADAADQATVAGRRLALVAGQTVALLLAFGLVAASQSRREVEKSTRRLAWLGSPGWQILTGLTAEVGLVTLGAAIAGWGIGIVLATIAAGAASEPVGPILLHSALAPAAIFVVVGAVFLGTLALLLVLKARPVDIRGASLSVLDLAALGLAATTGALLLRGRLDAATIVAERGTGIALLLLPGLIAALVAIVVVRVFPLLLRALRRALPMRAAEGQLAVLSLIRNPGRPAVTVAFTAVSLGLAIFAACYGSTLARAHGDQARFATGADFVLREDPLRLISVRRAIDERALKDLGVGVDADLVARFSGSLPGAREVTGIAVLGLDDRSLPAVDGWRDDFSPVPLSTLAARVRPTRRMTVTAPLVPAGADRIAIPVEARGRPISVVALLRTASGDVESAELGALPIAGRTVLSAPLSLRGPARLLALRFDPPPRLVERGSDAGGVGENSVSLGAARIRVGGRTVVLTRYRRWLGLGGVREPARGRLRITVTDAVRSYFRPRQPSDGRPLPVIVSPQLSRLAAEDGRLRLDVAGTRIVGRVVGFAERFPGTSEGTLSGDFAVADRDSLLTTLSAADPATGEPNELWIETSPQANAEAVAGRLRRPPFSALALTDQRQLEEGLRANPVARAAQLMLVTAAGVAALLAFLGLALGVLAELRDERGELHDLESQGFKPSQLRKQIRQRGALIVLLGVAGAAALAAALSVIVIDIVAVTATGGEPQPPLQLTVDWPEVFAIAGAALLASYAFVTLATRRAFRGAAAGRGGALAP